MMQELLTGKTRLSGNIDEWRMVTFGTLAAPVRERIDPRTAPNNMLLVELEHMESGSGLLLERSTTKQTVSQKTLFNSNDILFGKLRAYLRKFWLADRSGMCSTEIWAIRAKTNSDPSYIRYLVETDRFIEAASQAYGTHMPRSDWKQLSNLMFTIPTITEQRSIDLLKRHLHQSEAIKQGMMQELLTGRTRLPTKEVLP